MTVYLYDVCFRMFDPSACNHCSQLLITKYDGLGAVGIQMTIQHSTGPLLDRSVGKYDINLISLAKRELGNAIRADAAISEQDFEAIYGGQAATGS